MAAESEQRDALAAQSLSAALLDSNTGNSRSDQNGEVSVDRTNQHDLVVNAYTFLPRLNGMNITVSESETYC